MDLEKELIKATENNRLYEFIADNYYQMPTWQLKEVLLAVLGVGYDDCVRGQRSEKEYSRLLVEELGDRGFGED